MNDDRQQYGNWSAAWGPMWPLMAPWVQAMRAWTTAMSGFTPGAIPPEWSPHGAGGAWGPGSSQTAASVQVSVQVSSSTPTEVVVTTAPGVEALPLVADALAIDDGVGAPPLVGVTLAGAPGRLRVCVTVPEDQPVGRYSGAIRNAAGVKVGDLTVIVTAPGGVSHASAGVSQG